MIDPAVDRQFSDTKELLALWNTFHQFFTIGVKGEDLTPEKENQFLELKSRIAMLHDSFMDALEQDKDVGQDVLSVITRAITLKHLSRMSTADRKKLESEWHEAYLLLNDTIAVLDQKRRELAEINEGQFRAKQVLGTARQKVGNFFGSTGFRVIAVIAVIVFATAGIQTLGIYDYDDLGKIPALKTPYNWGKAVVRTVWNADSPWPTIESMHRTGYASWPSGIKKPEVKPDATKDAAAKEIARLAQGAGVGTQIYPMLEKAVEYKKEVAQKQFSSDIEIHTFRFADAETAKKISKIWENAKSTHNSKGQVPEIIAKMDLVLNVNIISAVYSSDGDNMVKIVNEVYGKRA